MNHDEIVENQKSSLSVIPAPYKIRDKLQPESSSFMHLQDPWTPFSNGVTTFYEAINPVYPVNPVEKAHFRVDEPLTLK